MATGLGRVTRNLLPILVDHGYECAFVGWGEGIIYDLEKQPCRTFPFPVPTALPDAARHAIREFDPEWVVTFIDSWWVDWFPYVPERAGRKWLLYMNCDGAPLYPGWFPTILAADSVATTAGFGRKVVEGALPQLKIHVIPHGVDTSVFRHQPEARWPMFKDRFVVGCVARNMVRKQYPLLIQAFAEFRHSAPNAFLYLHADPKDPEGWDIPDLIRRAELGDCVMYPADLTVAQGLDDGRLAQVYAQFDLFALPTMGEGFGLPLLEAMACGVPVIATDCSGATELVTGAGRLIRPKLSVTGSSNVDQVIADVDHLVELMSSIYADAALRREMTDAGQRRAGEMTWEKSADAVIAALGSTQS